MSSHTPSQYLNPQHLISQYLNLGIVAHVDAGKTSLTERLLFEAGAIEAAGSVDAGTTRTDSMELERRRGITIRAAVTSFALDGVTVNLLDTPGHPDFVAEVERALGVLDAAVLVLSAVEGVQPQTVVIWRALQRIGVPTLLFVNKIDRAGADVARVLGQVRTRLTPHLVELATPTAQGTAAASVAAIPITAESMVTAIAETDDAVLARWVAGEPQRYRNLLRALRSGVRTSGLTPVLCGSAITGAGLDPLRTAIAGLLPRSLPIGTPAADDPPAGTVFAVDRDDRGRRAWLRLWSGQLRLRDRIGFGGNRAVPVTELAVSEPGGVRERRCAAAGQIAVIRGPVARIGDTLGRAPIRTEHRFAPPTLQSVVEPVDPTRRTALFAGLTELADQDPLIDLQLTPTGDGGEPVATVALHGEVQKEVIGALLADRYGVPATFSATSVVCLERVVGTGSALEQIKQRGNPYLAGIGLRIEPRPVGHGVEFSPGIERGNLPPAFINATEEGTRAALRQGLHGWSVTDCLVTMTASQYWPRQSRPHQKFDKSISSIAADFRHLAPVVLTAALRLAGTVVCRPIERFDLELPDRALPAVTPLLGRLGAAVLETSVDGGYTRLRGHLPSAVVGELARRLPDLTSGEGVLVSRLDHHDPVPDGRPPARRRTGPDPLDRAGWFRAVPR